MNAFEIDSDKLEKQLECWIETYPSQAPKYLSIISKAMENYKKKVDEDRSMKTINALTDTLMLAEIKKSKKMGQKVPFLINAAFLLFPEGNCDGHSGVCKNFFQYFVDCCKKENIMNDDNREWLLHVKGSEYYDWMKIIMENSK